MTTIPATLARRVKAAGSSAIGWLDDLIEKLARLGRNHPDETDWDWAAASGGALPRSAPRSDDGPCPECWGADRAQASRAELALLRGVNAAGREEMSRLRHRNALLTDELAAERRLLAGLHAQIGRLTAELAAVAAVAEREVEMRRRDQAMAPKRRAAGRVA